MFFQELLLTLRLNDILVEKVLERHLLLINLELVAMEVPQLIRHAIGQLVLLNLKAALVDLLLAERAQFNLRRRPIRQNVIGLIQQVIHAVEISLNSNFHLIALHDLLPCTLQLIISFLKNHPMVLSQSCLLHNGLAPFSTINGIIHNDSC